MFVNFTDLNDQISAIKYIYTVYIYTHTHSSKNLKGLFEVLLSYLNEKSQNVENRHERRLKLQEDIPRFSNS